MKHRFMKIKRNSIGFKLVTGVYLFLLPLIAIMIFNNYYAVNVIHNQVAESYSKMMTLYMTQIDQELSDVDNYIYKIIALDNDFTILEYSSNKDQYLLSKSNLSVKMNEDLSMYKAADFIFVYSDKKDKNIEAFKNNTSTYDERENLRKYVKSIMDRNINQDKLLVQGWYSTKVNGNYYFFRIVRKDDVYVGAWIKPQNLLIPLNLINIGEKGSSLFATGSGIPIVNSDINKYKNIDLNGDLAKYYLTGDKKQFLVVGQKSAVGDFKLIALIPNKNILENMPVMQRMIYIILVVIILVLPMFFLLFRKIILKPISRLLKAIKHVREGNFDVNITYNEPSEEFKTVNEAFNKMVSEIKQLRIDVYEEQLSKQKAELEHLQLQVKPHFFLNSLNIIYSLAQIQDYKLIQEMTMCLVNYFRYMFKSTLSFVSLRSEVEHVRNYIRIQELRYPNSLKCNIDVSQNSYETLVPPLIIQTFIENTIKHVVTLDEPVCINIEANVVSENEKKYLKIVICDNGKGFEDSTIEKLNNGDRIVDENGEHIGIWNVKRRLHILYKGEAGVYIKNCEKGHGALVEVIIPVEF